MKHEVRDGKLATATKDRIYVLRILTKSLLQFVWHDGAFAFAQPLQIKRGLRR
jgi:hypothetical protein